MNRTEGLKPEGIGQPSQELIEGALSADSVRIMG
jgi:hypothetical protein